MSVSGSDLVASRRRLTFADLPKELRDLIWSFAMPAYYAKPQVHCFGLQDMELEGFSDTPMIQWEDSSRWATSWSSYALSPPDPDQGHLQVEDRHDWVREGNYSAYLIVGPLWHACSESREVLRRHFRRHYKKNVDTQKEKGQRKNQEMEVVGAREAQVVTFASYNDPAQRRITTRPGIDLMHISTNSLPFVDRSSHPLREYFDLQSFKRDGPGIKVQHFAVDFVPDWTKQLAALQEESDDSIFPPSERRWEIFPREAATALHGVLAIAGGWWSPDLEGTLWVIDYSSMSVPKVALLYYLSREPS